jgi:hypothetical protein
MAKATYNPIRGITKLQRSVASFVGLGIIAYSGWLTWQHTHDVAQPLAAVVGAGMFHFGETACRCRRWISGLCFGLLGLLAVAISLSVVIDRVSSRYDAQTQTRQSENLPRRLAVTALDEAKAELVQADQAAAHECASGRKAKCLGLEARANAARERVQEARSELAKLGALTAEDPSARRIAAVLGVSEARVRLVTPLLLPVWLELSGLTLLTIGLSPAVHIPETKQRKRKPRANRYVTKGRAVKKLQGLKLAVSNE